MVYRVLSKEDKRINHVHLSDYGKETFLFSLPVINKITDELQNKISSNDLTITIGVLDQIQKNIIKKIKLN